MPPQGIYRVAETVSATWRSQRTDSAPVRVTLRARPNSFSSAYLPDISETRTPPIGRRSGKPIGSGAHARHDELARTVLTVPYRSPNGSPSPFLPLRYNNNCAFLFAHDTRAVVGPPMSTNHVTILGTLASGEDVAAIASRPPPARLPHRHDRHR